VPFDDQLRRAFRREKPDAGFAERTMAVIEQRSRRDAAGGVHGTWMGWLAIAAAMLLFVFGGVNAMLTHQRALRARQNVELGLRVASDKLNHVQMKLVEASARRGVPDAR
jgi:hypothetical protein